MYKLIVCNKYILSLKRSVQSQLLSLKGQYNTDCCDKATIELPKGCSS